MRSIWLVATLLAACGDDDGGPQVADAPLPSADMAAPVVDAPPPIDGASIDMPPSACQPASTVTGSVTADGGGETHTFGAQIRRAFVVDLGGVHVIVLDERDGATAACGSQPATGSPGAAFSIGMCSAPAVGTTPVVGQGAFDCPGTNAAALVEKPGSQDFASATGGSVTITTVDGSCVGGTFAVTFGAAPVTGTFSALRCP